MKRPNALCLTFLLVHVTAWTQPGGLRIGDLVGTVHLVSPEHLSVAMNNYGERRATVVLFLSGRDPATAAAAEQVVALNEKHRHRRILFIGVFPDSQQTGEEVRAYCQARGFNFPVYLDPGAKVTHQFGASVTPEAFLLDQQGKLVYRGTLDGLSAALTSFEANGNIANAETAPVGTPIGKPFPKPVIDYPYGSVEFSSELVFETIPRYPVHHCSSITEAPNGDLLVSWYGGSYESSDDQVLFLSRKKKGSRFWSKPEIIVRSPGKSPGNAVLFTDKRNRIWLVWGRMEGTQPMLRGTGWDHCRLFCRTSDNNGVTWSEDQPFYHDTLGWLPRNLTVFLSDGSLVLPLSDELHGHGVDLSFFLSTKDNGATWTRSGIMRGGEQPTFIERSDGSLVAFLRTRPNILQSESRDGGKTWSEPHAMEFKNPDAGISARRLKNGHVILVFNNQDNARTPLHIVLSTDEARTWNQPLELESNPGEYSYPSVLQTSDGRIHIIYTFRRYSIKHVEMNEGWLTHFQRPD
jgi:predicted neuraminidase/peroxiredoxin